MGIRRFKMFSPGLSHSGKSEVAVGNDGNLASEPDGVIFSPFNQDKGGFKNAR
jgi:hypothetical protein